MIQEAKVAKTDSAEEFFLALGEDEFFLMGEGQFFESPKRLIFPINSLQPWLLVQGSR